MKLSIKVSLLSGMPVDPGHGNVILDKPKYYKTYVVDCTPEIANEPRLLNTYALGVLLEHYWTTKSKEPERQIRRCFLGTRDPASPFLIARGQYELEVSNV